MLNHINILPILPVRGNEYTENIFMTEISPIPGRSCLRTPGMLLIIQQPLDGSRLQWNGVLHPPPCQPYGRGNKSLFRQEVRQWFRDFLIQAQDIVAFPTIVWPCVQLCFSIGDDVCPVRGANRSFVRQF